MHCSPQDGGASGSNGGIKWGHGREMVPSDHPSTTTSLWNVRLGLIASSQRLKTSSLAFLNVFLVDTSGTTGSEFIWFPLEEEQKGPNTASGRPEMNGATFTKQSVFI